MDKKLGIKARAEAHRKELEKLKANDTAELVPIDESEIIIDPDNFAKSQYDPITSIHEQEENRAMMRKRLKVAGIIATIIVMFVVLGIVSYNFHYGESKVRMDREEYFGGTMEEDQLAIVLNSELIDERAIKYQEMVYMPYEFVRDNINGTIYWDYYQNLLLYSFSGYTEKINLSRDNISVYKNEVSFFSDEELYISMEYIEKHSDVEFQLYEGPNRVVVKTEWNKFEVSTIGSDTKLRGGASIKEGILIDLKKGDQVTVVESGNQWSKISSADGYVGYVESNYLNKIRGDSREIPYVGETYDYTLVDYKICMGWHLIASEKDNDDVQSLITKTEGKLTNIVPSWFSINDINGEIKSMADQEYVDCAHELDVEVWASLNDYDGGIGTFEETYNVLSRTDSRNRLVKDLIHQLLTYNIDGININFELVSEETAEHYLQFLRELAIECRLHKITLSVDTYPVNEDNTYLQWEDQIEVVDYIVVRNYDEYNVLSDEAGPVASASYTLDSIEEMMKYVPASRIINVVPFFNRIWEETEKTASEMDEEIGTEQEGSTIKLTSHTYGMDGFADKLEVVGTTTEWDEETKNNYASWKSGRVTYRVWVEDAKSVKEKLSIVGDYKLAGIGAWKLGIEDPAVWDVIGKYLDR